MVLVTTVCNAILCDFSVKNAKARKSKICVWIRKIQWILKVGMSKKSARNAPRSDEKQYDFSFKKSWKIIEKSLKNGDRELKAIKTIFFCIFFENMAPQGSQKVSMGRPRGHPTTLREAFLIPDG